MRSLKCCTRHQPFFNNLRHWGGCRRCGSCPMPISLVPMCSSTTSAGLAERQPVASISKGYKSLSYKYFSLYAIFAILIHSYRSHYPHAERRMACIFCGGGANIRNQDNPTVVVYPFCKRETGLDTDQGMFDRWNDEIRKEG